MPRVTLALLVLVLAAAQATAQTVRFDTSVGSFDVLLNPTDNDDLQPLVDNFIANVGAGVYHSNVVNRADTGFVLQIGSFQFDSNQVSDIPSTGFESSKSFDPVVVDANNDGVVDFDTTGLSNTFGTISLALSAGNANSGSASFFVNLTDNSFLDSQGFVPFATIADMSTVNRIMALQTVDLSSDVGQSGSLAYTDIPLDENGDLVLIETATVVSDDNMVFVGPIRNAYGIDELPMTDFSNFGPSSASALTSGSSSSLASSSAAATSVPEPTALLIAAIGATLGAVRRRA